MKRIVWEASSIIWKDPYIPWKEPCILRKEFCIPLKEPYILWKGRALHLIKRTMFQKNPIFYPKNQKTPQKNPVFYQKNHALLKGRSRTCRNLYSLQKPVFNQQCPSLLSRYVASIECRAVCKSPSKSNSRQKKPIFNQQSTFLVRGYVAFANIECPRVAKTHRMPYLRRSFSAEKPYD